MALWKPFLGTREALDTVEKHPGYVYWCTDDGSLHFDYTDADGNLQRKQINAKDAETLCGMSLEELKKYTDDEVDKDRERLHTLESIDHTAYVAADTSLKTELQGKITDEENRAKGVEASLNTRIKAIEDNYLDSSDKEELQTQINTIINNPDTEGVINSINEFTQYIEEHGEIAEGFRKDIDANKKAIESAKSEAANQDIVVLHEAQTYTDSLVSNYATVEQVTEVVNNTFEETEFIFDCGTAAKYIPEVV